MSGLLMLDERGRILSVNARARALLGLGEDDLPDHYREIPLLSAAVTMLAAALSGALALPARLAPAVPDATVGIVVDEVRGREGRSIVVRLDPADEQSSSGELSPRLRAAIDALPDGFILFDPTDRMVAFNAAFVQMYGEYPLGMTYEEGLKEGLRRGLYPEAVGREADWLEARLQRHRHPSEPIEQPTADGRWIRILERRLPDGGTVGLRVDITELKRRERALADSESRLRQIIELSRDCIIGIDDDDRIVDFNRSAETTLERRRGDVLGRDVVDLLVPARLKPISREALHDFLGIVEGAASGRTVERISIRGDGMEFPCEIKVVRTAASGSDQSLIYLRDISRRLRSEQALREAYGEAQAANRSKAAFLAHMSHELRTPLNAIVGLSALLASAKLKPEEAKHVALIEQAGDRLTRLVDDILDYSTEPATVAIERKPFDVSKLVEHALGAARALPGAERLGIAAWIDPDCPATLVGDATQLRRILDHLLDNAVKFTTQGSVSVTVLPVSRSGSSLHLRLEVRDTGTGLSEEARRGLFRPFEPGGDVLHRTDGAGLGLAISRQLVQALGGEIGVDSGAGRGTTFWIEVPVAVPEGWQKSPVAGLRILIVEPLPTTQILLKALVERSGHVGDVAADRATAQARLRDSKYDLVILGEDCEDGPGLATGDGHAPPLLHLARLSPDSSPGQAGARPSGVVTLAGLRAAIEGLARSGGA
ncbi:MAG: PAS domain S-box protein [Reyranellaceae bacterium]